MNELPVIAPEEWGEIKKKCVLPELPEYPVDALPFPLNKMALEISKAVKVPVSLAASALLAAVGIAAGKNSFYKVKEELTGRANIYMLIFAARGERKSSVESIVRAPFKKWMKDKFKLYAEDKNRFIQLEKRKEYILNKVIKSDSENVQDEIELRDIDEELMNMPPNPDFFSTNITQEALIQKLSFCGGRAAVFTDDGRSQLKMMIGMRYSSDGDAQDEVFLDAFDGTKNLTYERSNRVMAPVENPCIGLMMMLQPDMLPALGSRKEVFESGLMSRCLFCFPDSMVGKCDNNGILLRAYDDVSVNQNIADNYNQLIYSMLEYSYNQKVPEYTLLTPEARELWIKCHDRIESESGPGGKYHETLSIAVRYPSMILRLAFLISLVKRSSVISLEDIQNANLLMNFYIANVKRCMAYMSENNIADTALRIINYALTRPNNEFIPIRDIYRACRITALNCMDNLKDLQKRNICYIYTHERSQYVIFNPQIFYHKW